MRTTQGLALAVAALAAAGCTATAPTTTARAARPLPPARCTWYTPTTQDGQQVIVNATGPACGDPPVIDWIVSLTRKTWITTRYVTGTCIAQLGRAGAVVQIWQTGFATATDNTAGYLADKLQAAGWAVQVPPSTPGGPRPPPATSGAPGG